MTIKRKSDSLSVKFTCASTVEVGDIVEISADSTVSGPTGPSNAVIGEISVHEKDATECTVDTKFRVLRDDRIAAEAVTVGPFAFGADNKVYGPTAGITSDMYDGLIVVGNTGATGGPDDTVTTLEY